MSYFSLNDFDQDDCRFADLRVCFLPYGGEVFTETRRLLTRNFLAPRVVLLDSDVLTSSSICKSSSSFLGATVVMYLLSLNALSALHMTKGTKDVIKTGSTASPPNLQLLYSFRKPSWYGRLALIQNNVFTKQVKQYLLEKVIYDISNGALRVTKRAR